MLGVAQRQAAQGTAVCQPLIIDLFNGIFVYIIDEDSIARARLSDMSGAEGLWSFFDYESADRCDDTRFRSRKMWRKGNALHQPQRRIAHVLSPANALRHHVVSSG